MPRTNKQFETIRKEKKELILNTALRLFAEKGFYSVSISEIAKESSISKGLIYNYFTGKDDLLRNIMFEAIDVTFSSLDMNHDGILQHDELIAYLHRLFENVRKNITYWKLFFALSTQPGVVKIVSDQIKDRNDFIAGLFYDYFKLRGYQKPHVEIAFLGALISGTIQKYIFSDGNFPLDEVEEKIVKMYNNQ